MTTRRKKTTAADPKKPRQSDYHVVLSFEPMPWSAEREAAWQRIFSWGFQQGGEQPGPDTQDGDRADERQTSSPDDGQAGTPEAAGALGAR